MGNSRKYFIGPVMAIMNPPDVADPEMFIKTYAEKLDVYDDDVLKQAAENIIWTTESFYMPRPKDCLKACSDAAIEVARKKFMATRAPRKKTEEVDVVDMKQADEIFSQCTFASSAVAEGWQVSLWDWILRNGEEPREQDIGQIRHDGLQAAASLENLLKEGVGTQSVAKAIQNKTARISSLITDKPEESEAA